MNRVAIVDYGLCNLDSVRRAVEELGGQPTIVSTGETLGEPDHIILPGVGSFPDAMRNLRARNFIDALEEQVNEVGVPLLGICLGMQLLSRHGHEGTSTDGLGWIAGDVVRLEPAGRDRRIPHAGWNEVDPTPGSALFADVAPETDFYFVHSYHLVVDDPTDIVATTPYCGGFTSAVGRGPVMGVQFHPEKSQRAGFTVLANFLAL